MIPSETVVKGGAGIVGAVVGSAAQHPFMLVLGGVVTVLMIVSLSFDIYKKWRDRNK